MKSESRAEQWAGKCDQLDAELRLLRDYIGPMWAWDDNVEYCTECGHCRPHHERDCRRAELQADLDVMHAYYAELRRREGESDES